MKNLQLVKSLREMLKPHMCAVYAEKLNPPVYATMVIDGKTYIAPIVEKQGRILMKSFRRGTVPDVAAVIQVSSTYSNFSLDYIRNRFKKAFSTVIFQLFRYNVKLNHNSKYFTKHLMHNTFILCWIYALPSL